MNNASIGKGLPRAYPPLGPSDTIIVRVEDLKRFESDFSDRSFSPHCDGSEKLFADEEILQVHVSLLHLNPPSRPLILGAREPGGFKIEVGHAVIPVSVVLRHGKIIHTLQQQAIRSCMHACGSMLLLDSLSRYGIGQVGDVGLFRDVTYGSLDNDEGLLFSLGRALRGSGLRPKLVSYGGNAESLAKLVSLHGAAAVDIGGELGGHEIVVNRVYGEKGDLFAEVRDPFHGWLITVPFASLVKRRLGSSAIVCEAISN